MREGGGFLSNPWDDGNAARDLNYTDTASNPYAPLNYAERLKKAGKKPSSATTHVEYTPGQLYGGSWMTPPKPMEPAQPAAPQPGQPYVSTPISFEPLTPPAPLTADPLPPAPAPQTPPPAYLQHRRRSDRTQQEEAPAYPPQTQAGLPYSADLFQHQPTAYMPTGNPDEIPNRPFEPEPYFEPAARQETPAQETDWRDPFTPAAPKQERTVPGARKAVAPPATRPPVRIGRVAALIAAALMLLFCVVVGGSIVLDLLHNERGMEARRDEYLQRTGTELHMGAARVDLLPKGQTYQPTATPSPTPNRPTPTPVIAINEAAVLGMSRPDGGEAAEAELITPTPALRSRATSYPKNPLCNVLESISVLAAENADVVGRLVIDGVLDEIVMQRNNTYYLTHNSLGVTSQSGAVFADESCTFRLPPENLLLRGQSSVPGKVFAPLWQFVQGGEAFVSAHTTARLTTLYEEETYELFAVITAGSDPAGEGYFNYASQPTFTTDEAMMNYVAMARQRSLYQFSTVVEPDDRLLTLATLGGDSCVVLLYAMKDF